MSRGSSVGLGRASKVGMLLVAMQAGCSARTTNTAVQQDATGPQPIAQTSSGASGTTSSHPPTSTPSGAAGIASAIASGASGASSKAPQVGAIGTASGGTAKAGNGGLATAGPIGTASPTGAAGSGAAAAGTSAAGATGATEIAGCEVKPLTDDLRGRYESLDEPYYTKYASANGVIVATGAKVADEAVIRYCRFITEMVSNQEIRDAMLADKMWFTMIDEDEQLSDLPQIDRAYGMTLNARARGLGSLTPTICAEDSIMCHADDKWRGDCICPHEAGHTLHSSGIQKVPELSKRLTEITQQTRSSGRLSNAYVWMDGNESGMMAWGVQVWYNCAINGMMGGYHSDINTRDELAKEMPDFYQFLSELLPADNKYKDCYAK